MSARAAASLMALAALAAARPVLPNATLSIASCSASDGRQQLTVSADDSTVRSADRALCVTYTAASPAPLSMLPCVPGNVAQAWAFNAASGAFEGTPDAGGCVAWNTQSTTLSTWTCSDVAWNGVFTPGFPTAGVIAANFSSPTSHTFSGDCVAAVNPGVQPCSTNVDCSLNGV